MNKSVLRVLIWCCVLLAFIMVLPIYTILDAMLSFSAAGAVPGTGVVLTPGQTIMALVGLGIASMLLLFRREIARALHRRRSNRALAAQTLLGPQPLLPPTRIAPSKLAAIKRRHTKPLPPKPAVVITVPGTPGLLTKAWRIIVGRAPVYLGRAFMWGVFGVAMLGYAIEQAIRRIFSVAARVIAALAVRLGWAGRKLWEVVQVRARKTRRLATIYWHLARHFAHIYWLRTLPYLQRFDRYLEIKFKQNEGRAALLKLGREIKALCLAWYHELNAAVTRLTKS